MIINKDELNRAWVDTARAIAHGAIGLYLDVGPAPVHGKSMRDVRFEMLTKLCEIFFRSGAEWGARVAAAKLGTDSEDALDIATESIEEMDEELGGEG